MRLLLLIAGLTACAGTDRSKGGPLVPFAPVGLTQGAPKRYALLVGVDAFEDPRFTPLRFAGADARAFGAALTEFDEVRVLATPEETTRASVLQAVEDLSRKVTGADDTVLFYFSSHGSLGRRPGRALARYLVARDTRLDLIAETGIAVDALVGRIERIPARGKVVFLATCHSGRGKSQVPDEVAKALAANKAPLRPLEDLSEAMLVFSAAAFGEAAKESDELSQDVYTHFLLRAFDAGDRDGDGAVTASEAHDYARHRTYAFTRGLQRPTSESMIVGDDPVVLRGKRTRAPLPVIYSYAEAAEGLLVRVDGTDKGVLPGGVALEAGAHGLELLDARSGEVLYQGEIDVRSGERIELSRLMPPPPAYRIAVGATSLLPLQKRVRREFVPATFGAEVRLFSEHLALRGLLLGLTARLAGGSGSASGINERLGYGLLATGGGLFVGWGRNVGPLRLALTIDGSALYVRRTFDTSAFESSQATYMFTAGGALDVSWPLVSWASLVGRVGSGALMAEFGSGLDVSSYLDVSLLMAVTL